MFSIRKLFARKEEWIYEDIGRELIVDIHSHLIPGIDDGASSPEKSLELIRGLQRLGYESLIATPHVMAEGYRNSRERIIREYEKILALLQKEAVDISLSVAAEYYMDDGLEKLIEDGEILTFGNRYILFETSYFAQPYNFDNLVYLMRVNGYTPVMAHPERYSYIDDFSLYYDEWREMGILFQVNLNSLVAYYGPAPLERARWLAERGMIDFLGSDLHNEEQLEALERGIWSVDIEKLLEKNPLKNHSLSPF